MLFRSGRIPDWLSYREPGHAIREFEADKRAREEAQERERRAAFEGESANKLQKLDPGGLWNKKFTSEIDSYVDSIEIFGLDYLQRAIAHANMEAVPRALKKEGWTVRHASTGRDKRRSSRYVVSPDGKFEVRLSDHYLPDTPEREYMRSQTGGPYWNEDIVVSGTESPRSIIDEIKDLYTDSVEDLPPSNLPDKATTVKRSPDFAESGEYVVTFGDGSTERIFRDTFQFGYSVWHRVGEDDPFNMGLGSTKAEALERLEERYQSQKKYEAGLNKAHGGFVVKPLYDRAP